MSEERIWKTRERRFVSYEELARDVRAAAIVLLGETHDNAEHHAYQLRLLREMIAAGRRPALVMEQLDREHQVALDAERARTGHTADSVLDAGRFDRRGWLAEGYLPLIALALEHGLPIVAANISRTEARAIVREPARAALPPMDPRLEQALAADIEGSHCGRRIEHAVLNGMVAAQRARDAAMAQALTEAARKNAKPGTAATAANASTAANAAAAAKRGEPKQPAEPGAHGAVLIAGSNHVRADRGVPLYLDKRPLVIGFFEHEADGSTLRQQIERTSAEAASYDYVWWTAPAPRGDPCAGLR